MKLNKMIKINKETMENKINVVTSMAVSWEFGEGFIQKVNPWERTSATTFIKWSKVTNYELKNIDTDGKSFIGYDRDGNLVDTLEKDVTKDDCYDIVWLGFVSHRNGAINENNEIR